MKQFTLFAVLLAALTLSSCTMKENPVIAQSPYPYGAPAFDQIRDTDYLPAGKAAIAAAKKEVKAIAENPEEPTFENTIEALEFSGRQLSQMQGVFSNLLEANTNECLQKTAEELSPLLTEFSMSIILNPELFQRVKAVYDKKETLGLSLEQSKLLEDTYKSFTRNGANLSDEAKAEYAKIAEELSLASLKFGNNVLAATNAFSMNLTDEADLAGLPEYVLEMAASEAKNRSQEGWTFTLDQPSYSPFMKFSEKRELREKMWRAYSSKAVGGEFDNTQLILKIIDLRTREARILGYETYSDYALEDRMAKTTPAVWSFLNDLMDKSLPAAKKDVADVAAYAKANGFEGELMPWDFSYWSEKYQNEKYAINEELLKPYFKLENVQAAIFDLANRLYGLNFRQRDDIPVYHPDVKVFEVTNETGRFMALLYMDYFPRESKRGGAWMTEFRSQSIRNGVEERPLVSVVTNFSKPTESTPALLTFDEVTTILHEFGHALHGIHSEGKYTSLAGTSVARDFVELPSQIMENWAYEPEYLKTFAKHYQTGELIPQDLIDKIVAAKNYHAGYAQVRQLQYGIIDMAWHSAKEVPTDDAVAFEQSVLAPSAVLPQVDGIVTSPSFNHIFSGGYSAGYYSYKWAEVLEADAFSLFKENGIFNTEISHSFRDNILSRGSVEDADVLYRNFRGRDPQPEALLEKLGLK